MQFLETLKSIDAKLLHVKYHQKRVENTLGRSAFLLEDILHPPKKGCYRCRLLYSKESYSITYHPYTLTLPKSFKLVIDNTIDYHKKYANREIFDTLKRENFADDEIIIVKNSLLSDTSIANIAFLDKDRWITPKTPLLQGTTRQRLLDEKLLHVRDISVDDIADFDNFAIMNAMTGFQIIENGIMAIKN